MRWCHSFWRISTSRWPKEGNHQHDKTTDKTLWWPQAATSSWSLFLAKLDTDVLCTVRSRRHPSYLMLARFNNGIYHVYLKLARLNNRIHKLPLSCYSYARGTSLVRSVQSRFNNRDSTRTLICHVMAVLGSSKDSRFFHFQKVPGGSSRFDSINSPIFGVHSRVSKYPSPPRVGIS